MYLAFVFGIACLVAGMASQWPVKVTSRDALLDAYQDAGHTPKDIYGALGYTQSHWSKIERGEAPLPPLDRLIDRLPLPVLDRLLPRLHYVAALRRQTEKVS